MKWLAVLALLVSCTPTNYKALDRTNTEEFIEQLKSRTVQIVTQCENGPYTGSGVVWKTREIATAAHVAEQDKECVTFIDTYHMAFTQVQSEETDVALMWFPTYDTYQAKLNCSDYYLGQEVVAIGYPRQWITDKTQLQVTRGHIIAEYGEEHDNVLRMSASFWFGSSGGPVWDMQGNLVGLTVAANVFLGRPIVDEYFVAPCRYIDKLELP
jgi:S1-C subfamily serine protease